MSDLVRRLRDHVNDRGGPAKDDAGTYIGTAWPMMLESADEIERLRSQLVSAQWRPIETAPKDGTSILVTDARVEDWTQVVWWDDEVMTDWKWAHSDADGLWHKDSFTHWMPLPVAPALTDEKST